MRKPKKPVTVLWQKNSADNQLNRIVDFTSQKPQPTVLGETACINDGLDTINNLHVYESDLTTNN